MQLDWQVAHLLPYLTCVADRGGDPLAGIDVFTHQVQEHAEFIGIALGAEMTLSCRPGALRRSRAVGRT